MDVTAKLTKRKIDSLRYEGRVWTGADGRERTERHVVWDEDDPSFGVRVHPSGAKTFVYRYRYGGRRRFLSLGRYGTITLDQARDRVKGKREKVEDESGKVRVKVVDEGLGAKVARGEDPVEDRRQRKVETVGKAWEHFQKTVGKGLRESTLYNHEKTYSKHLKHLARRRLDAIKATEFEELYADLLEESRYAANDMGKMLRRLYKVARMQEHDPTAGFEWATERKRKRYLSRAEVKALYQAVVAEAYEKPRLRDEGAEGRDVFAYVMLLILTGARPGEWRLAQWDWVDWEESLLRIPREFYKTEGEADEVTIELPAEAVKILKALPRGEGPHIFPRSLKGMGSHEPRSRNWMQKPWRRICEHANLVGVSLYTLRHTFGTWSVAGGHSLAATGQLMGHEDDSTTHRYAHAVREERTKAAERVATQLYNMMTGQEEESAEVN